MKPALFTQASSAPSLISSLTASSCPKDVAHPIAWASKQNSLHSFLGKIQENFAVCQQFTDMKKVVLKFGKRDKIVKTCYFKTLKIKRA